MPTYDYICEDCNFKFEESFKKLEESDKPSPCPKCKKPAPRGVSAPYVARAGSSRDSADMKIGAAAEKRWEGIHSRRAQKDKLRKEAGTNAITTTISKGEGGQINYQYSPTSKEKLAERKSLYKEVPAST